MPATGSVVLAILRKRVREMPGLCRRTECSAGCLTMDFTGCYKNLLNHEEGIFSFDVEKEGTGDPVRQLGFN